MTSKKDLYDLAKSSESGAKSDLSDIEHDCTSRR